jgi:hypothetical protein
MDNSPLVIQWMKGDYVLQNYLLQPLYHDIKNLQYAFSQIYFIHVYMEQSFEVDKLSKE